MPFSKRTSDPPVLRRARHGTIHTPQVGWALILVAVALGGSGCGQEPRWPESVPARQAASADSETEMTIFEFLSEPDTALVSAEIRDDRDPGDRSVEQWQRRIRDTAAEWADSGRLGAFLKEKKLKTEMKGDRTSVGDLRAIARGLLEDAGLPFEGASISCRETAIAQAALAIEMMRAADKRRNEDASKVRISEKYRRLENSLSAGFDDLSNPWAFLDDRRLDQLVKDKIDETFPREHPAIRQMVAQTLANHLKVRANAAWKEFSLFVKYILFGNEKFGDRDTYLVYEGFQARQKAIEDRILTIISENPKYKKAILDPETVKGLEGIHPERNVKKLVRERATLLAETIRDVPTVKP